MRGVSKRLQPLNMREFMPIGAMAPPQAMLFSQLHSNSLTSDCQSATAQLDILKDMWHMQTAQY